MTQTQTIGDRYRHVQERIQAACERTGRDPADVEIVCVTKTVGEMEVRELVDAGATHLGENRLQDAEPKIGKLRDLPVHWHMIGHLQTNKAKAVTDLFQCVHSVDSQRVAKALNKAAEKMEKKLPVYIQVNVSGEESKYGLRPDIVPDFLEYCRALEWLDPLGLMTMAPYYDDPANTRPIFRKMRGIRDEMNEQFPDQPPLPGLSMGMSNDYEIAVEEGATIVRVGTTLFKET